jgi:peroxiredoxin
MRFAQASPTGERGASRLVAKFTQKHQLPFPLLCDPEGKVATLYGSYGPKKFMGREFVGVYRQTFAIAPDGTLEKIYRKVKPATHAIELFGLLLDRTFNKHGDRLTSIQPLVFARL